MCGTNPVIFRENPVMFNPVNPVNPVILKANPVIFWEKNVISRTNAVLFWTNPVKFMKIQ